MGVINRLEKAVAARTPFPEEEVEKLQLASLTALEAVTKGRGDRDEWNSLAKALNHSWTLAQNHIGKEVMPVLTEAEEAMKKAGSRYEKVGRIVLDGEGIRKVRAALWLWYEQLRLCVVAEVERAAWLVEREYWKHQH